MKGETNKLCFCDCKGFVVDDNYFNPEKGIFGWCITRQIPITKTEMYRDRCRSYSFKDFPDNETMEEKDKQWGPLIKRWQTVTWGYSDWFKNNFKPTRPHGILDRVFYKKPKYDNICPSCYGRGIHGCMHTSSKCETCNGYGGYNDKI